MTFGGLSMTTTYPNLSDRNHASRSRASRLMLGCGSAVVAVALMGGCATSAQRSEPASAAEVSETPLTSTPAPSGSPTAGPEPRTERTPSGGAAAASPLSRGDVADTLASLPVKGRAPRTGYARDQFGHGWSDEDADGCDTRNEILQRDLQAVQLKSGSRCLVAAGMLNDPYSGTTMRFLRGTDTSADVQIDHVVSLGDAWQTGAQQLSPHSREALANDPLNLVAVDGSLNSSKGDSDAASWLPPNKGYRCAYVSRQVAVKAKYGLWVTPAERAAIGRVLVSCPGHQAPAN